MTSPHDSTSMEPTPFSAPTRGTSAQGISDEQYRLIVQSIKDYAVFMLSPEGLILSWNEGARLIKGYTAPEVLGRSFEIFYPQDAVHDGFPQRELKEAARVGRFEDEGWRIRKDGSRFWANVVITAIRDSDGKLVGFAKVTRDLTSRRLAEEQARQLAAEQAAHAEAARRNEELYQLNVQLESALALAERSTRVRDDVLAVVAHDLRNPVHTILGAAGVVEVIPAGQAHDRHVNMIQRAARRMERLISDLLDVASIESGTLSVRSAPVDLTLVVSEVVEMLDGQARERKIDVHREIEPGLPVVMGDHDRLMQVLSNLLGNAIKFTPEGGNIRVRVSRANDRVAVSVADSGVGISPTDLPHVFDRFWRASDSSAKGAGLGLSIACGIIEAHGGKIWAESELGVGTTMTFAVPVTPARRSTRISRHINAPRVTVYRTLLDADAVARWKVPDGMTAQVHEFDAREGGRIRVSLTYDNLTATGKTTRQTDTYHGRFVKLVPNEEIVEVDEFETTDPAFQGEMTITITLADADGGTELRAVHEGLPKGVTAADNETGWRMALAKLAALVEALAV